MSSLPGYASYLELLTALIAPQVLLSALTGPKINRCRCTAGIPAHRKIILLEPRRLAARNVAQRLWSRLTKSCAIPAYWMRAKLRRAEYPPGSGYRRRADAHDPA